MESVDLNKMRAAGKSAAATLQAAGNSIRVGMTTADIDRVVHNDTLKRGGVPATLNYRGFPASCCVSVNDVVCHGIPGSLVLNEGDIVNVDVTTILDGHYGDTSATFCVGACTDVACRLVNKTEIAMWEGIRTIKPGVWLSEIGAAIYDYTYPLRYSIVREFGGHGIGRRFHTPPHVNHFRNGTGGPQLVPGMIITVEPITTLGAPDIIMDSDGWTVRTRDGSLSAQFEHTVLVTETGFEVLTELT